MKLHLNKLKTYREEQYRSLMRIIHPKYLAKDILQIFVCNIQGLVHTVIAKQVDTQ